MGFFGYYPIISSGGFMFGSYGMCLVLVAGVIGAVSFLWDYNGLFCYKKKAIKY